MAQRAEGVAQSLQSSETHTIPRFCFLRNTVGPIAHVVETIDTLRGMGILIGSTTGYTQEMMDIVIPSAAEQGYKVDNCVTSDNLPAGAHYVVDSIKELPALIEAINTRMNNETL